MCAVATDVKPWETTDKSGEIWQRFTLDSGAAITTFPLDFPGERVEQKSSQSYRTASGEVIPDEGAVVAAGVGEDGVQRRVRGRLARIHKPLVAAGAVCDRGHFVWLTADGGVMLQASDPIVQRVAQELNKERPGRTWLYRERGVYNFYVRRGGVSRTTAGTAPETHEMCPADFHRQAQP